MTKKLWTASLLTFVLVLAACSKSASTTTPTEPAGDVSNTEVTDEDNSTTTADLLLVAPVGASTDGYEQTELTAPAAGDFTIEFDNNDEGVSHNMQVTDSDEKVVFEPADGATTTGIETTVYNIVNLKAGTYSYNCQVHPATMTGTLTVG